MNRRNWCIAVFMVFTSPWLMAGVCDRKVAVTCLTPQNYSRSFLEAAEKELDVIAPQAPHLVKMLSDHDVNLRAIRACIRLKMKKK